MQLNSFLPQQRVIAWLQCLFLVFASLFSISAFSEQGSLWNKDSGFSLFESSEPDFLPVDEAFVFASEETPDGLLVSWTNADGYYLYQDRLSVKQADGSFLNPEHIEGIAVEKDDPAFGLVQVFYDRWQVLLKPNQQGDIKVQYQGCADAGLCYPPTTKVVSWQGTNSVEGAVEVAVEGKATPNVSLAGSLSAGSGDSGSLFDANVTDVLQQQHWSVVLLIFFVLGLGLAFTPCVLPMLPILSSVVVNAGSVEENNQQNKGRFRVFMIASAYVLGMAITYSLLGVAMAGVGDAVHLQAWLQQPVVVISFAILFVLLALSMFGLYELQLPEFIRSKLTAASDGTQGHGLPGSLALGAISALIVSPCVSGPLAGVLLYISTTQHMLLGGSVLFVMAIGMGLPLMAVVLGGKSVLPQSGGWMDQVKNVFGLLLLLMALYLVKHLLSSVVLALVTAMVLIVYGVSVLTSKEDSVAGWFKGVAVVVLLYAVSLFSAGLSGHVSFTQPLSFLAGTSDQVIQKDKLDVPVVKPGAELAAVLDNYRQRNKPLMLDVLADWCVSCFVMEREILVKEDVKLMMTGVDVIKVDVTAVSDENALFLKENKLFGPPAFIFIDSVGDENGRLVGEVSKEEFMGYFELLSF